MSKRSRKQRSRSKKRGARSAFQRDHEQSNAQSAQETHIETHIETHVEGAVAEEGNAHFILSHRSSDSPRKTLFISKAIQRIRAATDLDREQLFGMWDYLIISLSIASMFMIFMQLHRDLSPELTKLLRVFDWVTCAFFFIDFLLRLVVATSKRAYLKWGWIDLISSIPMLEAFRWGRVFRLIRIVRAVRGAVKSTQKIKVSDPFLSAVMIYSLCVFLGAASVLYLEAGVPGSNIKSARDAIWWAMVTVTTVGYGDFTPVTNEGRLLAVILMSSGIGLFGVFSVQCTQYLLKRWHDDEDHKIEQIQSELAEVRRELQQVHQLLRCIRDQGGPPPSPRELKDSPPPDDPLPVSDSKGLEGGPLEG